MGPVVTPTSASPAPSRSYTWTAFLSPSSELPTNTNNAISDVRYQGLGVSPPSLHLPSTTDLLSTSNLGLCRLSVSAIIELDVGATIVVVFSESSLIFKRFKSVIYNQMKSDLCHIDGCGRIAAVQHAMTHRHSFLRHGQTYYEFPCHLVSYPKRHELFDCTVDESTLCRWVDQGKGFTVELHQYPRRAVLKWKELRHSDMGFVDDHQ
jgi:hypothetical protein